MKALLFVLISFLFIANSYAHRVCRYDSRGNCRRVAHSHRGHHDPGSDIAFLMTLYTFTEITLSHELNSYKLEILQNDAAIALNNLEEFGILDLTDALASYVAKAQESVDADAEKILSGLVLLEL